MRTGCVAPAGCTSVPTVAHTKRKAARLRAPLQSKVTRAVTFCSKNVRPLENISPLCALCVKLRSLGNEKTTMRRLLAIIGGIVVLSIIALAVAWGNHNALALGVIRSVAARYGYRVSFSNFDVGLSQARLAGVDVTTKSGARSLPRKASSCATLTAT